MRQLRALLIGLLLAPTAFAGGPEAGDRAPDFVLRGSDGRLYELEQFRNRREVVLAWFPKAFTPG